MRSSECGNRKDSVTVRFGHFSGNLPKTQMRIPTTLFFLQIQRILILTKNAQNATKYVFRPFA